jgi:O-antigen ligase
MTIFNTQISRPRRSDIIRYGGSALVISVSAALAYLIATDLFDPSFALAGVLGVIGVLILYRLGRFEYGIIAVALSAGLINFFTLPTGRESRIVVSLALTLVLLALWLLQLLWPRHSGVHLARSPINKPLLVFVVINLIAYVWGNLMRDALVVVWPSFPTVQIAALLVNIGLPLFALMSFNKLTDIKWWRALAWIMVGLGYLSAVSDILRLPTEMLIRNGSRGLFATWVGAFAFALLVFDQRLGARHRVVLVALLGLLTYQYVIERTAWLSGWLPMICAWLVIALARSRKLFVAILICGLAFIALNFDIVYTNVIGSNEKEGSTSRLELWELNLRHIANHPFFGMGPAGYAVYNVTYNPQEALSTHNNYFDVAAQTGLIGFVSFLVLMGTFIHLGIRNVRNTQHDGTFESAFAAATLAGAIAAMVAMALGDWVLPFAYNQSITGFDNAVFTWLFMGGIAALYRLKSIGPKPDVPSGARPVV